MLTKLKARLESISPWLTDPAVVHAYVAVGAQLLVATPLAMLGYPSAFITMSVFMSGFYLGRERRQAETGSGSNRILPWDFRGNPDGPRQAAVPAGATLIVAGLVALLRGP